MEAESLMPLPPVAEVGHLVDRGVWYAPVLGPSGEAIQFAATYEHRLVGESIWLPTGASAAAHRAAALLLRERLDNADPEREAPPELTLIRSSASA